MSRKNQNASVPSPAPAPVGSEEVGTPLEPETAASVAPETEPKPETPTEHIYTVTHTPLYGIDGAGILRNVGYRFKGNPILCEEYVKRGYLKRE